MAELREKRVVKQNSRLRSNSSLRPVSSVEHKEEPAEVITYKDNLNLLSEDAANRERVLAKVKAAEEADLLKKKKPNPNTIKNDCIVSNENMTSEQFSKAFDIPVKEEKPKFPKPTSKNYGKMMFAFSVMLITLTSGLTLLGITLLPNINNLAIMGVSLLIAVLIFAVIYICEKKGLHKVTDIISMLITVIFGLAIIDVVWKFGVLIIPSLTYLGAALMTLGITVCVITLGVLVKSARYK